ncbi:transcriptional regulator [Bacillus canaveralius]|uniref:Transcriptional regulator n=1 Tax=Bacillus canaveralius TaxID=1403243 RepID=A0A2N5GMD6_9BACI|nr:MULTISPECIES: Rrf2 family transcriptional regulator [Bacillus]PLR83005.1 transcriptional regulator [Bacillus canaveralius]PLR87935.1 transcriptional regulator [Bacillus sp. V33-4]PLR96991.1 transcriptional regulator [Bacillus canaveralius]RSK47914.1 Rrf2 family transcriptional regulator [Bacillus canaveralius]
MKISSRGEYALRALICLGSNKNQLTSIGEISEKTLVPINYLEQLLLQLKRNGYVQSKRGVNGGYKLSRSPRDIIIGEVIRNLEGPLAPMGCVSITSYESCPLEEGCLLKPLWALVRDTVADLLDHTTLKDLLDGNIIKK